MTDVHDHASLVDASVCNVWPAWIATKDGGATPGKEKLSDYIYLRPVDELFH